MKSEPKNVKMDLGMARYFLDHQEDGFSAEYEICEKCGAMYIPNLGHLCYKVIIVPIREEGVVDEDRRQKK